MFISSLPPFRIDEEERFIYEEQTQRFIDIPTVHVVGTNDFVKSHSLKLYAMCDARSASLVVHDKSHEIPGDKKFLAAMKKAIRELSAKCSFLS